MLTEEQAKSLMEPHEERITDACSRAFQAFAERYGKLRHNHSRATDANILRDLLLTELRRAFDGTVNGANFITVRGGLTVLNFGGLAIARIKRLSTGRRPRKGHTKQSENYLGQLEIEGLPDEPTKLHIGYIPNRQLTEFAIWITCQIGPTLAYAWQLSGSAQSILAPLTTTSIPLLTRNHRVITRRETEREQGKEHEIV